MHMGWVDQLWIWTHAGGCLVVVLRSRTSLIWRVICIWKCSLLNSNIFPTVKEDWYCQNYSYFCATITWTNQTAQGKAESGFHSNKLAINGGCIEYRLAMYEKVLLKNMCARMRAHTYSVLPHRKWCISNNKSTGGALTGMKGRTGILPKCLTVLSSRESSIHWPFPKCWIHYRLTADRNISMNIHNPFCLLILLILFLCILR